MSEEMKEKLTGGEEPGQEGVSQEKEVIAASEEQSSTTITTVEAETEPVRKKGIFKNNISKKKLGIIGGIAAVIVIVGIIVLFPSKFERVKNKSIHIAGQAQTGKNYFILDTDPYENMDSSTRAVMLSLTQENTLEAIKYANEELGFPSSVYSDMMKTSAIMGRQTEENEKYKVSWTYHPDHGLEVTYTKK